LNFNLSGAPNQQVNGGPFANQMNGQNSGYLAANNAGQNGNAIGNDYPGGLYLRIIVYPVNPQHVQGLFLDEGTYASRMQINTPKTTCDFSSNGQLMKLELR
jgi:hypothetical protein